MDDESQLSYTAPIQQIQSWPDVNWNLQNVVNENRFQPECRSNQVSDFGVDRAKTWWSQEIISDHHHRAATSQSMEAGKNYWQADEQKSHEKISQPKLHIKDAIAEWRLRDGQDPDCAEFERLRTPIYQIVESDLSEVLHRRVVIIESLAMSELSHPRLLEVMSRCNEFQVTYVYKENCSHSHGNSPSLWEGMVILFLRSVTDAAEAAKYIQAIRGDLQIRILQANEHIGNLIDNWRDALKNSMSRLTDDVLLVSRVTSNVTKEKLQEAFPDALDIVVPWDRLSSTNSRSMKGYAYLTFGSRSRMLEAFNRYSSQPIYISGHLMRISKYEPPRDIPLGYLRLRRRLRVLDLIRDLQRAESFTDRIDREGIDRVKQHLDEWTTLLEKDNVVRRSLNLPTPSLEELHLLFEVPMVVDEKPMDGDDVDELLAASTSEQNRLKEIKSVHLATKTSFRRHESQKAAVWRKEAARKMKDSPPDESTCKEYIPWQDECDESSERYESPRKRSSPAPVRGGFSFRRRPTFQSRFFRRYPRRT